MQRYSSSALQMFFWGGYCEGATAVAATPQLQVSSLSKMKQAPSLPPPPSPARPPWSSEAHTHLQFWQLKPGF